MGDTKILEQQKVRKLVLGDTFGKGKPADIADIYRNLKYEPKDKNKAKLYTEDYLVNRMRYLTWLDQKRKKSPDSVSNPESISGVLGFRTLQKESSSAKNEIEKIREALLQPLRTIPTTVGEVVEMAWSHGGFVLIFALAIRNDITVYPRNNATLDASQNN